MFEMELKRTDEITLGGWLNYWLEDVIWPNRAYTTYYCYRNITNNHVIPALGAVPLKALAPWHIQHYYTAMLLEAHLSPNTVHKHHILLHTALHLACLQGVLAENPTLRVAPPQLEPARQCWYSPQQLRDLFAVVEGTALELPVKLAGYLGLRRGELCGLCWDAVDLRQALLHVRASRTTAGYQVVEKPPKTFSSVRTLNFDGNSDLTQLLCRIRQRAAPDGPFVVLDSAGRPWHPNRLTAAFRSCVRENGLPPITLHGLRHTFASVANAARVPLPDIGKALGHKDITITGRVYTHIFDQTHREVVRSVAEQILSA